jgi:hypothetical protein
MTPGLGKPAAEPSAALEVPEDNNNQNVQSRRMTPSAEQLLALLSRLAEGKASAAELAQATYLSADVVDAHLINLLRDRMIVPGRRGEEIVFALADSTAIQLVQLLGQIYRDRAPG